MSLFHSIAKCSICTLPETGNNNIISKSVSEVWIGFISDLFNPYSKRTNLPSFQVLEQNSILLSHRKNAVITNPLLVEFKRISGFICNGVCSVIICN